MILTKNQILAKNFPQLLIDGFKLFFKNALTIIPFFFCFNIIPIFINSYLLADLAWINTSYYTIFSYFLIVENFFENFFLRSFSTIAFSSIAMYLYEKYTKGESSFVKNFKNALNYRIILVWIVFIVIIPISYYVIYYFSLLLIILLLHPITVSSVFVLIYSRLISILLTSNFIFMIFTYNIRDNNSTLLKTKIYRQGSYLKIVVVIGLYIVIIEVIKLILSIIWNPSISEVHNWHDINNRRYDLIILNKFISSLPFLLVGALQIALLTPLFAKQIAKKRRLFEVGIATRRHSIT